MRECQGCGETQKGTSFSLGLSEDYCSRRCLEHVLEKQSEVKATNTATFKVKNFDRIPIEVRDQIEHDHIRDMMATVLPCRDEAHYRCELQMCSYCKLLQHFSKPMSKDDKELLRRFLK